MSMGFSLSTKHDFKTLFLLLSIEKGPRSLCVHFLSHNHLDPFPIRLNENPVLKLCLVDNWVNQLRGNGFRLRSQAILAASL